MEFDIIFIIGAVAWWCTALVYKDGPADILQRFRLWTFKKLGQYVDKEGNVREKSPLVCPFCTGPYVLILILIAQIIFPQIVTFFGILGIAAAVRGMSQEYN